MLKNKIDDDSGCIRKKLSLRKNKKNNSVNDLNKKNSNYNDAISTISEQHLLNNFIESIPDSIYFKDVNSRFVKTNKANAHKLGFENPAELIGKTDFDIFDRKNAEEAFRDEQRIIKTGKAYVGTEKKEVWKNGKVTWAISHKMPTYDDEGIIIGTFGFTRDITEKKKMEVVREALLRISQAAYMVSNMENIYRKIHEAVMTLMPAKNIFIAIIDEKTGKTFFPYFTDEFNIPPFKRKSLIRITEYVLLQNHATLLEKEVIEVIYRSNETGVNEKVPKILLSAPLKIGGKTIGVITVLDYENFKAYGKEEEELLIFVTEQIAQVIERKRNSEAIQKYAEELKQLNDTKDKFFSIIAHDLKSPFQGFIGITELLSDDINNFSLSELSNLIKELHENAKNLYRLLENLLVWARTQQGIISYNPAEISLNEIVSRNIRLIIQRSEQKKINIVNNVFAGQTVYADKEMLDTILRNLLSNALKFTKIGGSISVSSKIIDNMVEISILDNGVGMNEALVESLFKINKKVGRPGTEGEKSTGLGLLLCREFVEKHSGRIKVESKENLGSTFSFTLPITSGLAEEN